MKGIRIHAHGGPEVLSFEEIPTPEPGSGEAVVRTEAIGVNFIDVYHRTGLYHFDTPFTPGMEAAGTVESESGGFKFPDGTTQTSALPSGVIVMWSGNQVPSGWSLCDGTNGTPNLISRFILGSTVGNIGQTGGANNHAHTVNAHSHSHDHPNRTTGSPSNTLVVSGPGGFQVPSSGHTHSVNLPNINSSSVIPNQ